MEEAFRLADELGPLKLVHIHRSAVGLKAVVAIDIVACGPAIGGVRMAPDVSTEEAFWQPVHPLPGRQLQRLLGRDRPSSRFVLRPTMGSRATYRWRGCSLSSLRRAVGGRRTGSGRLARCSDRGGRRDIARSLADDVRRRQQGAGSRDPIAAGRSRQGLRGGGTRARLGRETEGRLARRGTWRIAR